MAKVTITFNMERSKLQGLRILDMADLMSRPVEPADLVDIECVKADDLYFKLPPSHDSNLQRLLVDEAIIPEIEALGVADYFNKYLSDVPKVGVRFEYGDTE